MTLSDLPKLREAIEHIVGESNLLSSSNDYLFIDRTFKDGIHKYSDRLSLLGFDNYENVLDAGSGL